MNSPILEPISKPLWDPGLEGEFTTHFGAYFRGWVPFTGGHRSGLGFSPQIGVTAAMGIAIGTSAIAVEGYNRWSGNHCEYKWGQLQEVGFSC